MKRLNYILCVSLFFAACEEKPTTTQVVISDTTYEVDSSEMMRGVDGATAQNSLDVVGIYKGVLPCADCEGMETSIELKNDSTYSRVIKYLGKKENSFTASGKWTWVNGFTINLGSIKEGPNQYFVAEGKLIQLDMSGNRITGELAAKYELKKQ
ncbi:MAG: hypothetical protein RLZZ429_1754 [Bacteroidota bacterium]|jgi:uncharacterized lipoprotein NlpE involved in copper resistance